MQLHRLQHVSDPNYRISVFNAENLILAGKCNLVLGEVESRTGPEFLALVLLAKIMQNPSNKDAVISEVSAKMKKSNNLN